LGGSAGIWPECSRSPHRDVPQDAGAPRGGPFDRTEQRRGDWPWGTLGQHSGL